METIGTVLDAISNSIQYHHHSPLTGQGFLPTDVYLVAGLHMQAGGVVSLTCSAQDCSVQWPQRGSVLSSLKAHNFHSFERPDR